MAKEITGSSINERIVELTTNHRETNRRRMMEQIMKDSEVERPRMAKEITG